MANHTHITMTEHDAVYNRHNIPEFDFAGAVDTPNRRSYKPRKPIPTEAIAKSTACNRKQNRSKHPWGKRQWGKGKSMAERIAGGVSDMDR